MNNAETLLSELSAQLDGMVDESSLRYIVERSQGPVYACERQAGGFDRAATVTSLLVEDLVRDLPDSKVIDVAILTVRTSYESSLSVGEMSAIDGGIRTVVSNDPMKFLFLQFEDSPVEDRIALSLLYWLKNGI